MVVGPKNIENPYKTPYLRKIYKNIKWRRGRRKRCLDTPLSERTPRNHHATTTGQQKTLQIPLRRKATSSGPISTLTPQQLLPRNTTKMVKKKKTPYGNQKCLFRTKNNLKKNRESSPCLGVFFFVFLLAENSFYTFSKKSTNKIKKSKITFQNYIKN